MSDRPTTVQLIRRSLSISPALAEGIRLTLAMAMIGQGVTIVTPIVFQQIIDEEILNPAGIDVADVLSRAGVAVVALIVGIVVGRAALPGAPTPTSTATLATSEPTPRSRW